MLLLLDAHAVLACLSDELQENGTAGSVFTRMRRLINCLKFYSEDE